ncbi:cyclophilin-like fold protein [Streptococcus jiangjianxini]|uniref:cyclophilin-like fold protein n=1 Tax=Streptococcus jiangjianxini TaxID=3161189 RepID=UPI0032ECED7B
MKLLLRLMVIIPPILLLASCSQRNSEVEKDMVAVQKIQLKIDQKPVEVTWEKNAAVEELEKRLLEGELELRLTAYGRFEQVGPLGIELPSQDKPQTAKTGDIMLYNSDKLVIFHGQHSWAYTKLGKLSGDHSDLVELLDKPQVLVTLSTRK